MNNSSSYGFEHLSECSSLDSTILTSTISIVSIVAFVGNTLVILTFLLSPTLKTSTNYFIVNMAISDLLSSSTNWPLYATEGVQYSKPAIDGSTAIFVCKLGLFFRAVSQAVSVQSLLLIVQNCSPVIHLGVCVINSFTICIVYSNYSRKLSNVLSEFRFLGQEEAIYLLRGRICSILLCSTYFHDYPPFKNHEMLETYKTSRGWRRGTHKNTNKKHATEQNCHESVCMDCECLFHLLDSTLRTYCTPKAIYIFAF